MIIFEINKFFKRKKNIIIITFLIVFIAIYVFANNKLDDAKQKSDLDNCDYLISSLQEQLDSINLDYKNNKLSIIKDQIYDIEKELNQVKEKKKAISDKDWMKELEIDIILDKNLLSGIKNGTIITSITQDELDNKISRNEYLLENKIEPMNLEFSMTSFNFIRLSASSVVPLILVIFIFLLTADSVSYEIDDGTYKILLTRSISRNKIIFSKIIAYFIICFFSITSIFIAFFILLGILNGFGSPQYPVLYDVSNFQLLTNNATHEIILISIASFVLLLIPLFIIFLFAIVTISIFVSVIAGNSAISISSSIIIYIAIYILNPILHRFGGLAQILPTTYLNIPDILDGSAVLSYSNNNITYINGIVSLGITALLSSVSALLVFRRKDIL